MELEGAPNVRKLTDGSAAGEYFPPELSLFQEPPLMAAYQGETSVDYRPVNANLNVPSLDYTIPPSMTGMIDLANSRHHLKVRIVKGDGTTFGVDEGLISPINWIGCTMFEQTQTFLNQVLVTTSGGQHHAYRCIIEGLLDRTRAERETIMQAGLYFKDSSGFWTDLDAVKTGLASRWGYMFGSNEVDLVTPLMTDLSSPGSRLLPTGIQVDFKFWRGKPSFMLMSPIDKADYKIEIVDAFLRIRKKFPLPQVLLGIESALSVSPCLFPHMRTDLRTHLLHSGTFGFQLQQLFEGTIPSVLTLGFVKSTSFNGDYKLNPFRFEHISLSSLSATIDDKSAGQPDFKFHFDETSFLKSSYLDGYLSLFGPEDCEDGGIASTIDIKRDEYPRGFTLITFRFNSAANQQFLPTVGRGNLKLTATFSKALTENYQVILMGKFPALMSVDKTRRVTL